MAHHLAQLNVARLLAPLDSPQLADFVAGLEPINALADASPGFVWRLQGEGGDATAIRAFDDDAVIVNMSTWESIDALRDFVHRHADHRAALRRRREWFAPADEASVVLWWVAAGHRPDPAEAKERLAHLQAHGPTAVAFTFRHPFPAPAEVAAVGELGEVADVAG